MFIKNINKFLEKYNNINKSQFMKILSWNNPWFDDYKFEKDFLLTLILIKFWEKYPDLIFKWWTCLNKIYFPYFRMSEDLDFVLNTDLWARARKTLLKEYENNFIEDLKILWINLREEKTKFDSYKLAMFTFEYTSVINNSIQTIKIDISLKNNLDNCERKKKKYRNIFYISKPLYFILFHVFKRVRRKKKYSCWLIYWVFLQLHWKYFLCKRKI